MSKQTGFVKSRGSSEKKTKGRKRYVVVDTQGDLLQVKVYEVDKHDTVGGCHVFQEAWQIYLTLKGACADAGHRKTMVDYVEKGLTR